MSKFKNVIGVLMLGSCLAAPAYADDAAAASGVAGHFQVRLRGAAVVPESGLGVTSSGTNIGGTGNVSDSFIPEADLTYFLTDNIGVEVIAGVTRHSIRNSVVGYIGSVELLPPTVTVQYHFDPTGPVRPYVGAGINYTFFFNDRSPLGHIGYKNNFGFALQAGADVPISDGPYFLNVDMKKIFLSTDATVGTGTVRAHATLNPLIIGAGVGVRF